MSILTNVCNTRYLQYIAALSATIITMSLGTLSTWPSPTLPILVSDESPLGIPLSDNEASWIVSLPLLVCLPFTFTSGWMLDKFGRKYTLLASAIPFGLPWIITIYAKSFFGLCIARSILGLGLNIVLIGCPMYCSEIADNDIRGTLSTTMITMVNLGTIMTLGVGPFVSYEVLSLICLSVPVVFFLTFVFMPESPYYLVKEGRIDEAKSVLAKLAPNNRCNDSFDKKIKEIELSIIQKDKNNTSTFSEIIYTPEHRKALFIMLGLKTLEQFSGVIALSPYLQTIVEASNTSIPPEVSSVSFALITIPSVLLATALVDKLGRRPLFILSALGAAISLIAEGVFFYLKEALEVDVSAIFWLPTTALVMFLFMVGLGVMTLPYVVIGEIFATNIKGLAMSLAVFYDGCLAFLLTILFHPISTQFGIYSLFWLFAAFCLLGSAFVFFCLPETKGKTLADIQKKLRNEHSFMTKA